MDKPKTTPKDFFLWAGTIVALYWSVIAFIFLFFNYINYALPNDLSYLSEPYSSGIPYEMASLVVVFPLFVALMWVIRRDIAHDASRADIWVRRWALIFTLFIAGLTAVVDVVILLTSFFRGEELTEAFLLKVLIVLFVAAIAFMHFIADLWGYWTTFPGRNRSVLYAVAVLVLGSVVAGFFIVGTPWQARQYRFDEERVSDLQNIQSQIVSYWQGKQALPGSLSDLSNSISGFAAPSDPQTNEPYEYRTSGKYSFELCATFNAETQAYQSRSSYVLPSPYGEKQDSWQHAAGHQCFERSIDPQLYPPLSKPL